MIRYIELTRNFQDGGCFADFRLISLLLWTLDVSAVFVRRKSSTEKVAIFIYLHILATAILMIIFVADQGRIQDFCQEGVPLRNGVTDW